MTDAASLLERFGLVTEEDLAALLGVTVASLRNRTKLPEYVRSGRRRLYLEKSVREYLNLDSIGVKE
jgi:hypothetical protein